MWASCPTRPGEVYVRPSERYDERWEAIQEVVREHYAAAAVSGTTDQEPGGARRAD